MFRIGIKQDGRYRKLAYELSKNPNVIEFLNLHIKNKLNTLSILTEENKGAQTLIAAAIAGVNEVLTTIEQDFENIGDDEY